MASYHDLMTISTDTAFQLRVLYALQSAAINVMAEDNSTTGHALRVAFAKNILAGFGNISNVTIGVLTNSSIASEANLSNTTNGGYSIPDGDITFAVNSLFSAFAGVAN